MLFTAPGTVPDWQLPAPGICSRGFAEFFLIQALLYSIVLFGFLVFVVPQTPTAAGFLVLWWEDAFLWLS